MALRFQPGQFYGALERARSGGAFDLRALAASGREEDIEVHTHEDAHFVLVLAGTYISSARGAPDHARPPVLVFNPPGTTHRDRFVDGRGAFLAVSLGPEAYRDVQAELGLSDGAVQLTHPTAIAAAFRIAREVRGVAADAGVLEAGAWELMGLTEPGDGAAPPPWAFTAYESVMDDAWRPELTVGAIAATAQVHPVHLARVFRQAWGCSPGELLRWRRVERASDLLLRRRMTAAEAAAETGFADQAHMTRAFRAVLGATPRAWLRAHDVAPIQDEGRAAA
jgi:AraC family transcriptional regulator